MSTSLSIKGKTQANDAVTSTINYVNPNATNEQLVSLATAMNNLTTNTVADITRIDKNSLTSAVTKLPRNLTLSQSSVTWQSLSTDLTDPTTIDFTADGITADTEAYVVNTYFDSSSDKGLLYLMLQLTDTGGAIGIAKGQFGSETAPENPNVVLVIPETATYQAATATLTIT